MKRLLLLPLVVVLLAGCQSAYYGVMERVGIPKREILVDRVKDARESQIEGQEQFKSALEQFRTVVAYEGGELEKVYEKFSDEFEDSVDAAEKIRERINAVENVAGALFDEWQQELGEYANDSLRRESERQLQDTRRRYQRLIAAMREAERSMNPVLDSLNDNVLYLKHNLNARAIASLRDELRMVNINVDQLIAEMERAIRESNDFIDRLTGESGES